jgi:hypothetical protein
MKTFTLDELRRLTENHQGPCVSVYMPTHPIPVETQQDRTRLKNLLRKAAESLDTTGLRASEAESLLDPAAKLLGEMRFWKEQQEGLALFISRKLFRWYQLPTRFEELVVVADRFHLKPLLAFLGGNEFFVLALSQNSVRLFEGFRFGMSEIDGLEGIPKSLAEALKYDELEKQLQFHTGTGARGDRGERAAMFHGHGVGTDDTKDRLLRYFRQVDGGLRDFLREKRAPLVLAAVEYLFPIYREVNTYQYLLDKGITGNPELLSPDDLHQQAWSIVQPFFKKEQRQAAARYLQWAATGKASRDIKEIVPAAYHGRVEFLFVAIGRQQWGDFDPGANAVRLHDVAQPGDFDILDLAAVQTLLHGGAVFAVEPREVPEGALAAAVFRY